MKKGAKVNPGRINALKEGEIKKAPVLYWMQRDQRVNDNWALLYAQECALKNNAPLIVLFSLTAEFNNASPAHYSFMLKGLEQAEGELEKFNISFLLLRGRPEEKIPGFIKETGAGLLVTDFNPIKPVKEWKEIITRKIKIPFHEVDSHNIVPCRIASPKQEFGAYTLRPKINKLLGTYLEEFPSLVKMKTSAGNFKNDWLKFAGGNNDDIKIKFKPGEKEALKTLQKFILNKLECYGEKRNDPVLDGSSGLSPYFHFGHLAPQRAALAVQRSADDETSRGIFLEELIIRRELADNFCHYNPLYDSFDGFHPWAQATLNAHRNDEREYLYSSEVFERAGTHDKLWNAAQMEMVRCGKMHGYLRMYWAKKILEWSPSPEEALKTAIYLNDKYELDGRDPNGYAGIAWSIGGVHDRAWQERDIFGKIRYMNYNGCRRKFNVDLYIEKNMSGYEYI